MIVDPTSAVVDALAAVTDPVDRLRALRTLRSEMNRLDDRLAETVRRALLEARSAEPRPTWAELGHTLGVTAQRAEQLSRTTNTRKATP